MARPSRPTFVGDYPGSGVTPGGEQRYVAQELEKLSLGDIMTAAGDVLVRDSTGVTKLSIPTALWPRAHGLVIDRDAAQLVGYPRQFSSADMQRKRRRMRVSVMAAGPAVNIASVANGGVAGKSKFTRAAGSWIEDGYQVGGSARAAGFATSSGAANGLWVIDAVTATDLTVLDSGDVIPDETAESGQTITHAPTIVTEGIPSSRVFQYDPAGLSAQLDTIGSLPIVEYETGGTSGNFAGIVSSPNVVKWRHSPTYYGEIRTNNMNDTRHWYGLADAKLDGVSVPSGIKVAAFRVDTSIGGENTYKCITCDGGSVTDTDTTMIATTLKIYFALIEVEFTGTTPTAVRFWMYNSSDNVLAGPFTHTTNIPTGTSNYCGFGASIELTAGTTSRKLGISRQEVELDA